MAFCPNCGSKVDDGAIFCLNCGTKLAEAAAQSHQQVSQQTPAQEPPAAKPVYQQAPQPQQNSQQEQGFQQAPQPQQNSQQEQGFQQAPQPQPTYSAVAVKEKKPVNKMLFIIIGGAVALVLIIVIVLALVLGGNGGASNDPNLGVWNAVSAEMMGYQMDVDDIFESGFSIELKKNGKCTMEVDGTKANGKWSLEDGAFHIEGGGVDCDGTLSGGVLVLENVMDTGASMTFEKEGGYSGADSTAAGTTALESQWEGTWYGSLSISDGTGKYDKYSDNMYDLYMVIEMEPDGTGVYTMYASGSEAALARGYFKASSGVLETSDSNIAGIDIASGGVLMNLRQDYPDMLAISCDVTDADSDTFVLNANVKKWGSSWDQETTDGFVFLPPGIDSYNQAIANNDDPPYSAEVIASFAGGSDAEASSEAPSSESSESTSSAAVSTQANEPSSTGDGKLASLDDLYRLTKWLNKMDYDYKKEKCTYEFVVDYIGVDGYDCGNNGDTFMTPYGDHYFDWYYSETQYIHVQFRCQDGDKWVCTGFNTSGFTFNDIPDSITVTYK